MEELRHNSLTFEGENENKKGPRKGGPKKGIISRGHVDYSQLLKWTSDYERVKRNKEGKDEQALCISKVIKSYLLQKKYLCNC